MEKVKQTRRRPAELRRLLLDASRTVFKERGFSQATVEEVVETAGVSVSVFYRHFRTKGALFREAVIEPFTDFLADFRVVWQDTFRGPYDELELFKSFLREMHKHLRQHRDALIGLVSADGSLEGIDTDELRQRFDEVFAEMRSWGEVESRQWSEPANLELTDRILMAMMSGLVVFEPWYLPAGKQRVKREDLIDHMARLFLYGVQLDPDRTRTARKKT